MGKQITVGEGHFNGVKIDHRNGKKTDIESKVEIRPVMEGITTKLSEIDINLNAIL